MISIHQPLEIPVFLITHRPRQLPRVPPLASFHVRLLDSIERRWHLLRGEKRLVVGHFFKQRGIILRTHLLLFPEIHFYLFEQFHSWNFVIHGTKLVPQSKQSSFCTTNKTSITYGVYFACIVISNF